ncbi:MAG: hypothetical protein NTY30_01705 [Candidatus Berkelbacteria bacterium]|nr:hypothetical protein [Candidatus Berkelbacteria bacterium]
MRKLIGLVSIGAMILSMCAFLFALPESVSAVAPSYPDQGCVNGVNNSGLYIYADRSQSNGSFHPDI